MNVKKSKKKIAVVLGLTIIIGLIFLPGYSKLHKLKNKNQKLLKKIEKLEGENTHLTKEQKKLKQDSSYIEKIAREELGLARDGEIIYKIEEKENKVEKRDNKN